MLKITRQNMMEKYDWQTTQQGHGGFFLFPCCATESDLAYMSAEMCQDPVSA